MAIQNSINAPVTVNADGFAISGGTTKRKLTLSGADVAVVGSGSATVTYPASTSTLATTSLSETWTNKTLTTPILTTPQINGHKMAIATKTTTYTMTTTDVCINADATGGPFTITLPAVSGNSGLAYWFVKVDATASVVTIDGNGAETINSAPTYTLTLQWAKVGMICNGTVWTVIT